MTRIHSGVWLGLLYSMAVGLSSASQLHVEGGPLDNLEVETVREMRQEALQRFLNTELSPQQRLEHVQMIGSVSNKDFESLLRIASDPNEEDEIRLVAVKRHPLTRRLIDLELSILGDAKNGGSQLNANLISDLALRTRPTIDAETRQRIQAGIKTLLNDSRDTVRLNAFRALVPSNEPTALQLLENGLGNPDVAPVSTTEALALLDRAGSVNHLDVIRPFLNSEDPEVLRLAVQALAVDPVSRPKIVLLLQDQNTPEPIRVASLRRLSRADDDFVSYALELFENEDESTEIRRQVTRAIIGRMNYQSVSADDQVRFAQAVERLSPDIAPSVLEGSSPDQFIEHLRLTFPAIKEYLDQ